MARHQQAFEPAQRKKFSLRALMKSLPPHRQQSHAQTQRQKRNHLSQPPPVNRFGLQPQNQQQRRRQGAGRRFAEERQRVKPQRQPIPKAPGSFPDPFQPAEQRQQNEKERQDTFQFRDPGDRFHLHRMQAKQGRRQPGARHAQSFQEPPDQYRIDGVQQNIDPMIPCRVQAPE